MREKIVAVLFAVIIVAVPAVTIVRNVVAGENSGEITEEGSIAELNREEQLMMQQALEENGTPGSSADGTDHSAEGSTGDGSPEGDPSGKTESTGGASGDTESGAGTSGDTGSSDGGNSGGFMDSLKGAMENFAGNLAFQEEAANANSSLTAGLADDAYIDSDQVLAGKGGWLFYKRADDGTSMADYQGTSSFSDASMQSIMKSLLKQRDIFAARGMEFVVMIVPNKEIIYSEYMPSTVYRTSEITRCDKLYEYLTANSDLHVVYPKADMLAAKSTCQLYYKYDTHWNYAGVYVGIQGLLRELYGTYVDIADTDIVVEGQNMSGDLASLIGMTDKYADDTYYNFYEQSIDPAQKTEDSILVIGDSFSDLMTGELGYYFSKVDQIGVWSFNMSVLDSYQPDVVLWQCAERYADRLSWIDLTDD